MLPQNHLNNEKKVLIVIVNYRTPTLTIDCLHSLANEVESLPNLSAIVVDNDSGDGSIEQIETAIKTQGRSHWATILAAERNGGYAYGNNLAIRPALASSHPPDYILLLNPDTIARPAAIKTLVDFMEQHPQVGIVGSRLEDPDGTPQHSAFRFHTLLSELESGLRLGVVSRLLSKWIIAPSVSEVACQTDWVAGASMMIRREVFESIGLMDEEYFMYYEEVDFCLQAKKAGWSCWYVPESRVVHLVGQSSGVTNTKIPPQRRPQYWFDSRRRYFLKNHGWMYAALADFLWLFGFILWRVRRVIQRKPDPDPPYLLEDFLRHATGKQRETVELGLWEQIKEDWIAHGRDWTKPGFRAVAVHRFGNWRMKIEPKLLRAPFSVFYRFLYRTVRNCYGIDLPYTVKLGRRVIIEHQHCIIIHGNCVIGDDCIIRQGVTLGNSHLDRPLEAPKLGARVNVGAGAKLLGHIIIGDDVNIGANAVVLSDIPAGKTAVGIPAKIVKSKSSQAELFY
ncbi:putative glycosyltransferase [Pleurocapsa sp. PCC 7327]|nr:glycosyltransferase [Pleurocapsa sp. PCC 7327]AFY77766.1 putative glycosyltransferase [Pleurocapsa sp. PCC 7327]